MTAVLVHRLWRGRPREYTRIEHGAILTISQLYDATHLLIYLCHKACQREKPDSHMYLCPADFELTTEQPLEKMRVKIPTNNYLCVRPNGGKIYACTRRKGIRLYYCVPFIPTHSTHACSTQHTPAWRCWHLPGSSWLSGATSTKQPAAGRGRRHRCIRAHRSRVDGGGKGEEKTSRTNDLKRVYNESFIDGKEEPCIATSTPSTQVLRPKSPRGTVPARPWRWHLAHRRPEHECLPS